MKSLKLAILGGGQLGQMLIQAALNFNLDIHVLDPDADAPCKNLVADFVVGSLQDEKTVYEFAKHCDVVTIEIENVNVHALYRLEQEGKKVYPQPHVIETLQNKANQKQFYQKHHIPTAEFALVNCKKDLEKYRHLLPAYNKLALAGYDGRGVQFIENDESLGKGFDAPGIIERAVDFKKEISVILARNAKGEIQSFPIVEMVFHPSAHLVDYLFAPADLPLIVTERAQNIAKQLIQDLNMIGLLAVEMFVTHNDEVLVNESAPRPHNSGHHTIEANVTSQYEQHLRTLLDLPLGETTQHSFAAMTNLIGEPSFQGEAIYQGLEDVLGLPETHVHLYGKKFTKPFRKMGHVTVLDSDRARLEKRIQQIKQLLKVVA